MDILLSISSHLISYGTFRSVSEHFTTESRSYLLFTANHFPKNIYPKIFWVLLLLWFIYFWPFWAHTSLDLALSMELYHSTTLKSMFLRYFMTNLKWDLDINFVCTVSFGSAFKLMRKSRERMLGVLLVCLNHRKKKSMWD